MAHVAVLIPCLNEEKTIAQVVRDFRAQLPDASIHVFDNGSTDHTAAEAQRAGAVVHTEPARGKGNVVRTMFRAVEADVYVMVDGDDTYPAETVHQLIEPIWAGEADMVVGSRFLALDSEFRLLNRAGNQFFLWLINTLFRARLTDIMSGLRAMSAELVDTVNVSVDGFEVEVELTIKALQQRLRIREIPAALRPRPVGSASKLRRFRDGFKILRTVAALIRDYRPLLFFNVLGLGVGAVVTVPTTIGLRAWQASGPGWGTCCWLGLGVAWGLFAACLAVGLGMEGVHRRFGEMGEVHRKSGTRTGQFLMANRSRAA